MVGKKNLLKAVVTLFAPFLQKTKGLGLRPSPFLPPKKNKGFFGGSIKKPLFTKKTKSFFGCLSKIPFGNFETTQRFLETQSYSISWVVPLQNPFGVLELSKPSAWVNPLGFWKPLKKNQRFFFSNKFYLLPVLPKTPPWVSKALETEKRKKTK